jgi:hypothetical protein
MVAFVESDECDGPVYLPVSPSETLHENLEDIYDQVGIEYNEFEYFVGDRKIDITKTFFEHGIVGDCEITPIPKASTKHDEQPFTCTVEAFEDYWGTYVGDDDSDHDLDDLETFFDGFDVEDELMQSKCQMTRMKQLEKSIKRDAHKFEHYLMRQWWKTGPLADQLVRLALLDLDCISMQVSLDEFKFNECLEKLAVFTQRVADQREKPTPKPKPAPQTKTPFDNFWKIKVWPNDKKPGLQGMAEPSQTTKTGLQPKPLQHRDPNRGKK